jgi:2-iminobutanoate/2-iminopropanoate deaminase
MEFINDKNGPAPCGPYSHSVRSGNLLFVSGQVPFHPTTGELVGTNIAEQAEQTMKNLASLLASANLGMENVVKTTVYLANWDDFAGFNGVYSKFMGEHKPARATVEVSRIAKNALLELEAVAEFPG